MRSASRPRDRDVARRRRRERRALTATTLSAAFGRDARESSDVRGPAPADELATQCSSLAAFIGQNPRRSHRPNLPPPKRATPNCWQPSSVATKRRIETLSGLHESAVRSAANAICRQPAATDDIVQKTFLALWERAARLTLPVRLRPWLVTVARNAAIDHLRAERPLAAFDWQHEPARKRLARKISPSLTCSLATSLPRSTHFPAAQRTVIVARYFEGRTFADIAARTGERLGTVKLRARLAIEALHRAIAE